MQAKKKPCDGSLCEGALQYIWKNEGGNRFCKACWSAQSKQSNSNKPTKRKPISPRSPKRIKQDVEYSKLRKDFLEKNPLCQAHLPDLCQGVATEIHHRAGKIGSLYCDVTNFLAICRPCHNYITQFSKEAIERGLSKKRNA